ncbi:MAG: hypothetical protein RL670_1219 [Actinomycetota bacterium]|jgi:hypothetical protein
MIYAPNTISQGNGFWSQVTSHEFTHLIQRYIMHGDFAPIYGWMLEGQADYIGANLATRNSSTAFASYLAQLISSIFTNSDHPEMLGWSSSKFVTWFKQQEVTKAPSPNYSGDIALESYVFGALAFQYLSGTYGFEAVTNLFQNLAKKGLAGCPTADSELYPGCTLARHQAFESAFGISLEQFYPKVAAYIVKSIGWSKRTVKKLPSNLLEIAPAPWAKTKIQGPYVAPPGLGPVAEYGNPMPTQVGNGVEDPYPANLPAPNRSCPGSEGVQVFLYGGSMTCSSGIWTVDPGQKVTPPPKP